MAVRRKVVAGVVAAVAVGGAGAGFAATELTSSSSDESKAIIDDAAKSLGVSPTKLGAALEKAFSDRIDAAVADGRLTKAQGEELKRRIHSGDFPLFGPPVFGPNFPGVHPFFHGLDAAAGYLGLSEAALRSRLNSGKTLAQIAKAQGKSVDGLKSAMLDDAKQKLDDAVQAGRLSKSEEQRALKGLESRIDDLVNAQLRLRFRDGIGPRFDGGFERHGQPPFLPGAAA
jgi:hypothetical protein